MKSLTHVFFWSLKLVTAFRASGSPRFLPRSSCLLSSKGKGEKWDLRGFFQRERPFALLDNSDFILLFFKGQSLPFSQGSFDGEGNEGCGGSFYFPCIYQLNFLNTTWLLKKGSSSVRGKVGRTVFFGVSCLDQSRQTMCFF